MKTVPALLAVLAISIGLAARANAADAAPNAAPSMPMLGAVGIGVKDFAASTRFYSDVLGMKVLRRFELGYLNEVVMGFPDASGANVVGPGRDPDNYVIELLAR